MLRPWTLHVAINFNCVRPVYIQIADTITESIKNGTLQRGQPLPGSRQLAQLLNVNRNTVIDALDLLSAEGWLVSLPRKGTFVAEGPFGLNIGASNEQKAVVSPKSKPHIVFDDGLPDTRLSLINELSAAYRQVFNRKGRWQMMGYSTPNGDLEFREAITSMLNFKRGMRLLPHDVFIARGSQMAMYLSAHCLLLPGDKVVVENPGYKPAWKAFESAGATLLPASVDANGLNTDELKTILAKHIVKAVYITPHHQFPTTVTLCMERRLELVSLSNQYGFTIIEDDYDNEFHFGQHPVSPVSSLENARNYVYIGTMSKIVAPALRIGYLASPIHGFMEKVSKLRLIIDVQGDNMMEQAMLQLINEGHIKRHLTKVTQLYQDKRNLFERLLNQYLQGKVTYIKPDGGLAFWLVPAMPVNVIELANKMLQKGIQIIPPADFSFGEPVNGLRLGYASLTEEQMEEGLKTLAGLLNSPAL